MTETESLIFRVISHNPMISQKDLADKMNMTRSAVSVHVSSLTAKGYIMGRGYVISEGDDVLLFGGTMMDIHLLPVQFMTEGNMYGRVKQYPGGVARNIAQYLSMLGIHSQLVSVLSDDALGETLKLDLIEKGIHFDHSLFVDGKPTSTYVSMYDEHGIFQSSLTDLSTLERMPFDHIAKKEGLIQRGKYIVIDSSFSESAIQQLLQSKHNGVMLYVPSNNFITKPIDLNLSNVDIIISAISQVTDYFGTKEPHTICEHLMDKGVKHVILILDNHQIMYRSQERTIIRSIIAKRFLNVLGIRDAIAAALIYAMSNDFPEKETIDFTLGLATISVENYKPVAESISQEEVFARYSELY